MKWLMVAGQCLLRVNCKKADCNVVAVREARLIVLMPEELLLIDDTREMKGAGCLVGLKQ